MLQGNWLIHGLSYQVVGLVRGTVLVVAVEDDGAAVSSRKASFRFRPESRKVLMKPTGTESGHTKRNEMEG